MTVRGSGARAMVRRSFDQSAAWIDNDKTRCSKLAMVDFLICTMPGIRDQLNEPPY
jgi:hypothetical protein